MEIYIQDMKILYNSVNYEDGWEKREKKFENFSKILLFHHFTPEISDRGDLLPIP